MSVNGCLNVVDLLDALVVKMVKRIDSDGLNVYNGLTVSEQLA